MTVHAAQLFASLAWGAPQWALPAGLLLAVALATLAWGYARTTGSPRIKLTAALLKAAGMTLLAALLVDPLWSTSRVRPGENLVVVLVDDSQSMTVRGGDGSGSPADAFRSVIADERSLWLVRLRQDFDVRRYAFGDRLEPRSEYETLKFAGRRSSLYESLAALKERFAGRPLAGVVLLSDGSATDAAPQELFAGMPPVYPVLPPETAQAADVALARVSATQTGFEDAPVTLTAEAHAAALDDDSLTCEVLDEAGKIVASQVLPVAGGAGSAAFRFQFRPEKEGLSFYQVRVAPTSQLAAWKEPSKSTEATKANNVRLVQVQRPTGAYRVLYVGGMPNPEHKFFGRAVAEDRQIELVSLLRIARREPKFDFRSRSGETTNPLFRGFDKTDDETEQYDQPVFVRLGTKDENELRDGFPKSAEQLFAYHAVVLDDVEAAMFTQDQMSLLSRFVSERGGGLLMLGGVDSFEKGGFAKTPIADALPVYLQRTAAPREPSPAGYRWELTREGKLEPWLRLRANEADEQKRIDEMPPFRTLNQAAGIKPGAHVLASAVESSGARHPALVEQTYGRGRSMALLVGDLWRWRLQVDPENQDLEKTWRQLIRRLTSDVPGRVSTTVERRADDAGQAMRIAVRVRDAEYRAADNAQLELAVVGPDGKKIMVDAEPSRREAGLYEATFVPRLPGAYRAATKVTSGDGTSIGAAEAGWTDDAAAEEFARLSPDRAALEEVAVRTQGEAVELEDLESFAAGLAARPAPETVQALFPLRHAPWLFAVAICCLAGEWGLRRWRGMP
jgi:uncharacterized membrane protein